MPSNSNGGPAGWRLPRIRTLLQLLALALLLLSHLVLNALSMQGGVAAFVAVAGVILFGVAMILAYLHDQRRDGTPSADDAPVRPGSPKFTSDPSALPESPALSLSDTREPAAAEPVAPEPRDEEGR
jgi:hypothetical protein